MNMNFGIQRNSELDLEFNKRHSVLFESKLHPKGATLFDTSATGSTSLDETPDYPVPINDTLAVSADAPASPLGP